MDPRARADTLEHRSRPARRIRTRLCPTHPMAMDGAAAESLQQILETASIELQTQSGSLEAKVREWCQAETAALTRDRKAFEDEQTAAAKRASP